MTVVVPQDLFLPTERGPRKCCAAARAPRRTSRRLINHFLRRFNKRFHRDVRGVAPEALAALSAYTFPGNVAQLENLIERAFANGPPPSRSP